MKSGEYLPAAKLRLTVVCAHCGLLIKGGKVWGRKYISKDKISTLPVSHGICPRCLATHFPKEFSALKREGVIQVEIELDQVTQ